METKTQLKAVKTPEERIRELKRENRKLTRELLDAKGQLDKYKQDVSILTRHIVMLENVVARLIEAHYKDKVKVDFTRFGICIDNNCLKFDEYEEFLTALRILPLLVQ
jgi:phage host-nuclease inhibitor protein Gam